MNKSHRRRSWGAAAVGVSALALVVPASGGSALAQQNHHASATTYRQVNLVSDVPGRAQITDPNLVNAWGASFSPTSPLWVSDNGTNVSTLYQGGVHGGMQSIVPLVVKIPGGVPTGQAFNPTTDFVVHGSDGSSGPAAFLFASESGHITGWNPKVPASSTLSTEAQNAVVTPGAVYKGLALGMAGGRPRLYAADFSAATVDVYNGRFQRVITPGNFEDRMLPAHYTPFNVAVLGDHVYVAYAKQSPDKLDEIDGSGLGRLDVFTMDGRLVRRLPQHRVLDGPWGLAIAPKGFGTFSGDLLVGNFGNGRIHAFNARTLRFKGTLRNRHHRPLVIDGLWALLPGNGTEAGKDQVIFTAGPDGEAHGLLGTLTAR